MMSKSVWKAIIVAGLVGTSGYVYAEPITVLGVNIKMQKEEIERELISRGFACEEDDGWVSFESTIVGGRPRTVCEKPEIDWSSITFQETEDGGSMEQIEIECGAVGICEYTLDEAAEMFAASVNAEPLSGRTEETHTLDGTIYWPMYCGRGEGDSVCMKGSIRAPNGNTLGKGNSISIYRENFGKAKPSFN